MSFQNFMSKVRHWDNLVAKWFMRHFYILFFEFLLVLIFMGFFINVIKIIDTSEIVNKHNAIEQLLFTQNVNILIIVILIFLNSFWMLYMFNSLLRLNSVLKEILYYSRKNKNSP